MSKHLYDPHMFNYMWESCIPSDDFIVGTYYIEDTLEDQDFIDHLGQVERLAAEGSTSSWMDVKELTPEVRERLMSKVLGYYEIPAPKGTKKAIIQLGFPTAAWDVNVNVPMLLLSIAGNCFAFPTKMRLLDIYIPEKLAKKFEGPKFGIPGVRQDPGRPRPAADAADHQAEDGHDARGDRQPGLPERAGRRRPVQGRRDVHRAGQLPLRGAAGGGAEGAARRPSERPATRRSTWSASPTRWIASRRRRARRARWARPACCWPTRPGRPSCACWPRTRRSLRRSCCTCRTCWRCCRR